MLVGAGNPSGGSSLIEQTLRGNANLIQHQPLPSVASYYANSHFAHGHGHAPSHMSQSEVLNLPAAAAISRQISRLVIIYIQNPFYGMLLLTYIE